MANGEGILFDRALLARTARALDDHDFLLRRVNGDIVQRLAAVMRAFPVAVNLGAHHGALSQMLARDARIGLVVSADPCRALLARCPPPRVLCEDEVLPFRTGALDLVVSGLSLHLVNDVPGTLVQIRRALKPDGLFLAAALGGCTLTELREALMTAEAEVEGGASPRVAPFADVRDYGGLLQRAGFALPVADTYTLTVTYESPLHLMRDIRAMGAGNVLTDRARKPLRRDTLKRAEEIYAERFPAGDGRIRASFEIIHLSGWAPDPSQQKPLKPGSARARLADALGTQEHSAGDKANPYRK